jgi:hypothetical protein
VSERRWIRTLDFGLLPLDWRDDERLPTYTTETFGHGLGTLTAPEKTESSEPCGSEPDADERT